MLAELDGEDAVVLEERASAPRSAAGSGGER
jgi:hypothetical protein